MTTLASFDPDLHNPGEILSNSSTNRIKMLEGCLWGSKKTRKNDVAEVQEKLYTLNRERLRYLHIFDEIMSLRYFAPP
jgi:hypothetical protein